MDYNILNFKRIKFYGNFKNSGGVCVCVCVCGCAQLCPTVLLHGL